MFYYNQILILGLILDILKVYNNMISQLYYKHEYHFRISKDESTLSFTTDFYKTIVRWW